MRTFKKHLSRKLTDERFAKMYEEERKIAELSLRIQEAREIQGLSQVEVAKRAQITQQQLSKIENGINCNFITFLKVCDALDLEINITRPHVVKSKDGLWIVRKNSMRKKSKVDVTSRRKRKVKHTV